ncbi:hypothetical protein SYNTR_2305 [Candidatus Syntrophocurvum alkaliphilum]|uniref:Uncharacterized protein n=1 Tax=Candidatus Syntrophocurvum alkaliphilum TaxID=2293317 RepID=A0A6I6DK18_9FIRM|nr:hypothetical protein SYNTR_2305 [Candidatus Syntrophocurvum alkaliphilum]
MLYSKKILWHFVHLYKSFKKGESRIKKIPTIKIILPKGEINILIIKEQIIQAKPIITQ